MHYLQNDVTDSLIENFLNEIGFQPLRSTFRDYNKFLHVFCKNIKKSRFK